MVSRVYIQQRGLVRDIIKNKMMDYEYAKVAYIKIGQQLSIIGKGKRAEMHYIQMCRLCYLVGLYKAQLCLIQIMIRPNIKVLMFLMGDFLKFSSWSEGLAHSESTVQDVNTVVCQIRVWCVVLREKNCIAASCIFP